MTRWLAIGALAGLLAGCDQNMDEQPRYSEYSRAPLFRGSVLRQPPPKLPVTIWTGRRRRS